MKTRGGEDGRRAVPSSALRSLLACLLPGCTQEHSKRLESVSNDSDCIHRGQTERLPADASTSGCKEAHPSKISASLDTLQTSAYPSSHTYADSRTASAAATILDSPRQRPCSSAGRGSNLKDETFAHNSAPNRAPQPLQPIVTPPTPKGSGDCVNPSSDSSRCSLCAPCLAAAAAAGDAADVVCEAKSAEAEADGVPELPTVLSAIQPAAGNPGGAEGAATADTCFRPGAAVSAPLGPGGGGDGLGGPGLPGPGKPAGRPPAPLRRTWNDASSSPLSSPGPNSPASGTPGSGAAAAAAGPGMSYSRTPSRLSGLVGNTCGYNSSGGGAVGGGGGAGMGVVPLRSRRAAAASCGPSLLGTAGSGGGGGGVPLATILAMGIHRVSSTLDSASAAAAAVAAAAAAVADCDEQALGYTSSGGGPAHAQPHRASTSSALLLLTQRDILASATATGTGGGAGNTRHRLSTLDRDGLGCGDELSTVGSIASAALYPPMLLLGTRPSAALIEEGGMGFAELMKGAGWRGAGTAMGGGGVPPPPPTPFGMGPGMGPAYALDFDAPEPLQAPAVQRDVSVLYGAASSAWLGTAGSHPPRGAEAHGGVLQPPSPTSDADPSQSSADLSPGFAPWHPIMDPDGLSGDATTAAAAAAAMARLRLSWGRKKSVGRR